MTEEPEGIPAAEYRDRLERTRAATGAAGLAGLVAFGDCWRGATVGYFTEFRPLDGVSDIANALVVLPVDGEPALIVSEQCLGYAASVTGFPVRPFRDLDRVLAPLARRVTEGPAGRTDRQTGPRDRLSRSGILPRACPTSPTDRSRAQVPASASRGGRCAPRPRFAIPSSCPDRAGACRSTARCDRSEVEPCRRTPGGGPRLRWSRQRRPLVRQASGANIGARRRA
jgi:hypothetical protein